MADDADLAAIRDWVAQGGKITVDKEGNPVLPTGVLPSGAAGDEPTTTPTPAAPAAPTPPPTPTQPTQPTQPAQPKAPKAPKQAKQPTPTAPKQRTGAPWYERLSDWIGERAANAPTPGGNLALLLLLLFFAFAIIPVNAGKTRLQLIWLVLTGGADLPGQGAASGPTASQSASALQAGATGGALAGTGLGTAIGGGLIGGLIPTLSGGGPGGPNAAGYIPPSQQSGAGAGLSMSLLEPPR